MIEGRLSRRYARALFNLAREGGEEERDDDHEDQSQEDLTDEVDRVVDEPDEPRRSAKGEVRHDDVVQ